MAIRTEIPTRAATPGCTEVPQRTEAPNRTAVPHAPKRQNATILIIGDRGDGTDSSDYKSTRLIHSPHWQGQNTDYSRSETIYIYITFL